jgi:exopolyphosphatase/guanosine-5'-triphosphate,3'-diphosphate pyrophosphatase
MKSQSVESVYPLRMAFIDLGSNTFNLLIAEIQANKTFEVLFQDKIGVGIGKNGMKNKAITPEAMQRGLDALEQFEKMMFAYEVKKCLAIGTSALRNANNANEFVKLVKQKTSIEIEIIDGIQEATYIYKGVYHEIKNTETVLVMDIGGGSVEFIIGQGPNILWKKSLEIGGLRVLEQFTLSDPMQAIEIESIINFFKNALEPIRDAVKAYQPQVFVGASGSFDTIADIDSFIQTNNWSNPNSTYFISQEAYKKIASQLLKSTKKDRMATQGMIPLRLELMPLAILLINEVNQYINCNTIVIARSSMKEGILMEQM